MTIMTDVIEAKDITVDKLHHLINQYYYQTNKRPSCIKLDKASFKVILDYFANRYGNSLVVVSSVNRFKVTAFKFCGVTIQEAE